MVTAFAMLKIAIIYIEYLLRDAHNGFIMYTRESQSVHFRQGSLLNSSGGNLVDTADETTLSKMNVFASLISLALP